jgi:hypothetical protein
MSAVVPKEAQYLVVTTAIFYACTRLLRVELGHLFALGLATLLVGYMKNADTRAENRFYEDMEARLAALGSPPHLHLDSNLIVLFYEALPWRQLNPDTFDAAILAIDNVCALVMDSEKPLVRPVDSYEVARDFATLSMNLMHSLIYSLDADEPLLTTRHKNLLERLQSLLVKQLKQMQSNCGAIERAKGRTVDWSYVPGDGVPQPYSEHTPFEFFGSL